MPAGNPEHFKGAGFKPGQSGNPGGKTKEQRQAEVRAAELAAKIQAAMLEALAGHVTADPAAALESIKADPLKLIKDAMDRAHGQPAQPIEVTNQDAAFARFVSLMESAKPGAAGSADSAGSVAGEGTT